MTLSPTAASRYRASLPVDAGGQELRRRSAGYLTVAKVKVSIAASLYWWAATSSNSGVLRQAPDPISWTRALCGHVMPVCCPPFHAQNGLKRLQAQSR